MGCAYFFSEKHVFVEHPSGQVSGSLRAVKLVCLFTPDQQSNKIVFLMDVTDWRGQKVPYCVFSTLIHNRWRKGVGRSEFGSRRWNLCVYSHQIVCSPALLPFRRVLMVQYSSNQPTQGSGNNTFITLYFSMCNCSRRWNLCVYSHQISKAITPYLWWM